MHTQLHHHHGTASNSPPSGAKGMSSYYFYYSTNNLNNVIGKEVVGWGLHGYRHHHHPKLSLFLL